jgi:predicted O-methyltransferase YrrM
MKASERKISRILELLGQESEMQKTSRTKILAEREMIAITADTGMFYSILLRALGATKVLEIGTSSGYSSLWFSSALVSNASKNRPASIVTIESNPAKVKWARENFRKAGVDRIVRVVQGEAIEALQQVKKSREKFDFVFIDADKENIINYFELVLPIVRPGGIIGVDNMLLPEHFRPMMRKYSDYLAKRGDVHTVTVPIGMGEEITIKIR